MLGYVLGPEAYRHWYMELHITLREKVAVDTIHPVAMKEVLTHHIRKYFSHGVTNDIKSFLERGGVLADYVRIHQSVSQALVDDLNASSSRKILQAVLKPVNTPQVTTPRVNTGGGQGKAGKSTKTPAKKHLSGLKGFCLHWLQHGDLPCQGQQCKTGKLLHRTEWDACTREVRANVLATAKLVSPGVTFKVQP